jgi:hypothetical protein
VRKIRRLPIKGEVFVKAGEAVKPHQVVAQAMLPGILQTLRLAERLNVDAKEAKNFLKVAVGDKVEKGALIAEKPGVFGRWFKDPQLSDYSGVVESVSDISGHLLIREPSTPIDLTAYIEGKIVDVLPEEGAVVETRGAMVQGIFGVGGEHLGVIRVAVAQPEDALDASAVQDTDKDKILVGGSGVTFEGIQKAAEVGAAGIVVGGVKDSDLIRYLGYDIGVAITGQEAIPLTLVCTEGFGFLPMAHRTFNLLKTLEGKQASINGATQIRAGVIRPEVIVPLDALSTEKAAAGQVNELKPGTPIRIIREPYFGRLGAVTELPPHLLQVDSGAEVRVLKAKLDTGEEVTVPRANVEIIAT